MQVKSIAECSLLQNAPREHSAILLTFIKLPFVFNTFVLTIFEWLLKIGFTVHVISGFESSQIFNLHFFASGIFGYLLNGKTTCIFDNFSFMNRNSEISCCFIVN